MLEEQGKSGLINLIKKALHFFVKHTINLGRETEQKLFRNATETGKKSVKSLVKMGGDLEISEEIKNKDHLKIICNQCKNQGLAFGIKKTAEGNYKIVYQRKHSSIISDIVKKVITNELTPKPKLSEIFNNLSQIQQKNISIKSPIKHREVDAR